MCVFVCVSVLRHSPVDGCVQLLIDRAAHGGQLGICLLRVCAGHVRACKCSLFLAEETLAKGEVVPGQAKPCLMARALRGCWWPGGPRTAARQGQRQLPSAKLLSAQGRATHARSHTHHGTIQPAQKGRAWCLAGAAPWAASWRMLASRACSSVICGQGGTSSPV